jgi:hypothetical protein
VVKAEIVRSSLLREPGKQRFVCDGDAIVGGCGEEFSEQDGVMCDGCQLFLCFKCFGATVIANECSVGGRYDAEIGASPSGSLPCPLFPQSCDCGHIPLVKIQRSLLHRSNRVVFARCSRRSKTSLSSLSRS